MRAREIMNTYLVAMSPSDSLQQVAERMANEQVGIVCICNEGNVPLGVITDRDIVTRACAKGLPLPGTQASAIMSPSPLTCGVEAPMDEVQETMKGRGVGRVLVVDETGKLTGIISLAEIWHYESPLMAGALSRRVTEREFRVAPTGGHFDSGREPT
jgi:CBS domain-containing protein